MEVGRLMEDLPYPSYEGWLFILTDAPVTSVRNPLHLYTTKVATTLPMFRCLQSWT